MSRDERTWAVARAIEIAILEHYQISPGLAAAIRSGQDQPTALGIALARAAEAAMDKHSGFLTAETRRPGVGENGESRLDESQVNSQVDQLMTKEETIAMSEACYTVVFRGDLRKTAVNLSKVISPFGEVVAISVGDALERLDYLEETLDS